MITSSIVKMILSLIVVAGLAIITLRKGTLKGFRKGDSAEDKLVVLERKRLSAKSELLIVQAMEEVFLLSVSDGTIGNLANLNISTDVSDDELRLECRRVI